MKSGIILTLVVCGLFLVQGAVLGDTIEMLSGDKKLKVQIMDEGIEKIIYNKGSLRNQTVPSDKVKVVHYHSTSTDYKTAQEAFANQDYPSAATLYEEYGDALGDTKKALQAHCLFMAAECYQKAGMMKEAVGAYTYFANQASTHRLYPEALLKRAQCYMNLRQMDKAKEGITILKNAIGKKNLPDIWKHETDYWLIYLREMKEGENLKRVLDDYKNLYDGVKDKFPKVANMARLRIGRVLLAQKQYEQAMAFFNEIIDTRFDAGDEVAAGAFVGRGRCAFNKPNRTDADVKSALYDFLRVVVSYTEVGSQQPEAMFWAGKCFQILGGKDATKRWQSLFRKLKREWGGNYWAQMAAKEI